MADTELYMNQQRLDYQLPLNQPNPSKFYTQFMYKAVIIAIFLVLLPLLPSQAPEFVNQSRHSRSWELVHILLVGIALSYGLFSKNNNETEKDHSSKFDNAQSYVSRLLQVSSVFDVESDSSSAFDENKVQTWSSQYSVHDEKHSLSASELVVDKPLLLPVRRLKFRVPNSDFSETDKESISQRFSSNYSKSNNGEVDGSISTDLEVKKVKYDILCSTIPSLPPSMEESDFNRIRFPSKPTSTSQSSPEKLISSKLSESQSKNVEDVPRKRVYYKPSPPPAPPLPPPRYVRKPHLVKSNSILPDPEDFPAKGSKRSVRSVPLELTTSTERGEIQNCENQEAESRSRVPTHGSLTGRTVRTIRPGEPVRESRPNTGFVDYFEREEKQEFEENMAVETDEESESEEEKDGLFHGGSEIENEEKVSNDGGKDVDKKADEFIAKFRKQIRLQRFESIKRSTAQIGRKSIS